MEIPLNLINKWDNSLRIFFTDMSFCASESVAEYVVAAAMLGSSFLV